MVRTISNEEVAAALPMRRAIAVMREAFADLAAGRVVMPPRSALAVPEHDAITYFMPAYSRGTGMLAQKTVSVHPRNLSAGLPVVQAILSLFDGSNGSALAVMAAEYLTALRTGAVSGLATQYMARPDSQVLGVLGTGAQARTQIWAVCEVLPIRTVRVWSLRLEAEYAGLRQFLSGRVAASIEPAPGPREAVSGADVLVLATTSRRPAIDGNWVSDGTHINAVGSHTPDARELDTLTVSRARVVCDHLAACLAEAGDLILPLGEGAVDATHYGLELADLVTGRKAGRTAEREVTLFKSVGLALEDLAAATAVYRALSGRNPQPSGAN
ncbi:MAG: ornithine cyclodeaminase family protein [Bacillota bacterium]|nr:ornithine cyclodeaminase family protein [Bacillota bacterium]